MVTKRYAHILDEDRKNLASEMEVGFYREGGMNANQTPVRNPAPAQVVPPIVDVGALAALLAKDTSFFAKVLQSVRFANHP